MKVQYGHEKKVFLFKNFVIKIPRIKRSFFFAIISMIEEPLIWFTTKDKRLAPVIFFIPFFCTVMRRAKPITMKEWINKKDIIKYIYTNTQYYVDIYKHRNNLGYINNELVLFDYNFKKTIKVRKKLTQIFKKYFQKK